MDTTTLSPVPTTAQLLDLVAEGHRRHGARVLAVVDVWDAHDVADVDAFLAGVAERLPLTRADVRMLAERLRPPWEK
jgi:hypothetical protein